MPYKIFRYKNENGEPVFSFDMNKVVVEPDTTYSVPDSEKHIRYSEYGLHSTSTILGALWDQIWSYGKSLTAVTPYLAIVEPEGYVEYIYHYSLNTQVITSSRLKIIGKPVPVDLYDLHAYFIYSGVDFYTDNFSLYYFENRIKKHDSRYVSEHHEKILQNYFAAYTQGAF